MTDQLTTDQTKPAQRMRAGSLTIPLIPWVVAAVLLMVLPFIFTANSRAPPPPPPPPSPPAPAALPVFTS